MELFPTNQSETVLRAQSFQDLASRDDLPHRHRLAGSGWHFAIQFEVLDFRGVLFPELSW